MKGLNRDQALTAIQAMPFKEGLINLTTGTIGNVTVIRCIVDGGLTLTFPSGGTANVTMEAGDDRTVEIGSTVQITSGTFDLA